MEDDPNDDYIEQYVCRNDEILENEIKTFKIKEKKGILIKQKGNFFALGNNCTHGLPLERGALGKGTPRCFGYGSCFNIETGDFENYPGLDSLPCFETFVNDDKIYVRAKISQLKPSKRIKEMTIDPNTKRCIIIIGGGPSSVTFVEVLRQNGYNGRIVMICKEKYLPYDRTYLSKTMDLDMQKIQYRSHEFYKTNSIEVLLKTEAIGLDVKANIVKCSDNYYKYTQLYIATGCRAKLPKDIPGIELDNIFTLRDFEDFKNISKQLGFYKELVILGSNFIGMEVANACTGLFTKITVVTDDEIAYSKVFGEEIGGSIMKYYNNKCVKFITKTRIQKFIGVGKLSSVLLSNGDTLKADMCVIGIGVVFNTDFLKRNYIKLNKDGSIPVNRYLQTNVPNIYAGGDVANAPIFRNNFHHSNIQHVQLAQYHGRIAALNMLGKNLELKSIPIFHCKVFDKYIRHVGCIKIPDKGVKRIIVGKVSELKFIMFYIRNCQVIAMTCCGFGYYTAKFAELLEQGKVLLEFDILKHPFAWSNSK